MIYSVKYAEQSDLPTIFSMYINALMEIPECAVEIDESVCFKTVTDSWLSAPCIIVKDGEKIIAFAGLSLAASPYSRRPYLNEYMFYVLPEYRSLKVSKILSEEAKNVADAMGLKISFTHYIGKSDIVKKDKFLKRWGYKVFALNATYGV